MKGSRRLSNTCFGCKASCTRSISGGCLFGYTVTKVKLCDGDARRLMRIPAEECTRVTTSRAFQRVVDSLESRAEAKHIEAIAAAT